MYFMSTLSTFSISMCSTALCQYLCLLFPGMKFIEIATAHLFVQFVFLGMQTIMLMVVMYIIFDNPYLGDTLTTFSLIFLIGVDGMFFGENTVFAKLMG
jgi:hypothetical protein